jgi:hypothetical protein
MFCRIQRKNCLLMMIVLQRFLDRLHNAISYSFHIYKQAINLPRRNRLVLAVFFASALLWGLESTVVLASPCFQEPPPTTTASQGNPLTGQGTEEPKKPKGYTVPIQFDPPQQPYILVEGYLLKENEPNKVDGKKPYLFLVDTGLTSSFLLAEWAVKETGFKITSAPPLKNGFQQLEPVKILCINQAKKDGFFLYSKYAAYQIKDLSVLSLFSRQPIAGVIGMGMLYESTSRFDLDNKTWTFYPDISVPCSSISDKGLTLPYRLDANKPIVEIILGEHIKDKRVGTSRQNHITLLFDTGSSNTTIERERIKGLLFQVTSPVTTTLLPSFGVAGQEFGPFAASVVSGDSSVLGMDFLSQFNITISGPDNTIYLEPRAGEAGRYRMEGVSGIYLREEKSGENVSLRVAAIGYPATLLPKSELPAIGDEIVSVDGVALEGLTRSGAGALLDGYADTTAIVTFRSSSPTLGPVMRQVKIRRVSPFDPRLAEEPRTK